MKKVVLSVMVVICMAGFAWAEQLLVYDLRVNTSQSGGAAYVDDHHATITSAGDVVAMTLYAVLPSITSTSTSNVNCVSYSLLSSDDGTTLRGALANTLNTSFSTIYKTGTVQDLDGDGDNDVGSTDLSDNGYDGSDWVVGLTSGSVAVDSTGKAAIATVSWTASAIGSNSDPTTIDIYPFNTNEFGSGHQFTRDTVFSDLGNQDPTVWSPSALEGQGIYTSGVEISQVPEPSTFILLGMGVLALLVYRRRK